MILFSGRDSSIASAAPLKKISARKKSPKIAKQLNNSHQHELAR